MVAKKKVVNSKPVSKKKVTEKPVPVKKPATKAAVKVVATVVEKDVSPKEALKDTENISKALLEDRKPAYRNADALEKKPVAKVVPIEDDKPIYLTVDKENKPVETVEVLKDKKASDLGIFEMASSGNYIFANRTHFELIFSDLGFASPGDKFDPLILAPYEERDLEKEGFEPKEILKSKNLRNFIASGKIKHGPLKEEDKLPDTTLFANRRNMGDAPAFSIPFQGHYFDLYQKFVNAEKRRYERAEV